MTKYSRKNLFGSEKSSKSSKVVDSKKIIDSKKANSRKIINSKKKKPFFDKSIFAGRIPFSGLSTKLKIKRIVSIFLIIVFLPFAIFTLMKGNFGLFFGGALAVYVLLKIINMFLDR